MGKQTEALIQFYRCLKQHPDFAPPKNQIKKVTFSEIMFDKQIILLNTFLEIESFWVIHYQESMFCLKT